MTLALSDIAFLASSPGERLLHHLSAQDLSETNTLRLLTSLRRDYAPQQAAAALEMARLRFKAVDKFGDEAHHLFFTRPALEQSSHPLVRNYRAAKMRDVVEAGLNVVDSRNDQTIVDACCSIGADTLAFAEKGLNVLGLDIDPLRIEIARYNASALGLNAHFQVADVAAGLPPANAVFFDPARRDEVGNRIYHVEHYQPPLSTVRGWNNHAFMAVKLSPGVDLTQLEDYAGAIEFISVDGDLKEALFWLGEQGRGSTATLLTQGRVFHWTGGNVEDVPLSSPRAFIVEPDPAILRAGLVTDIAARFNGHLLDVTIAYFTTDDQPVSPWLRSWRVLDWMPFNLKKLRAYLREHNVGQVAVKKRGTAIIPETLIAQLKLKGDESRTLVLTRCQGRQIVLICDPMPSV